MTRTFSVDIRTSESASTSTEPVTSPLMISGRSLMPDCRICSAKSFQRNARALGQLRVALLHLAVLRDALGLVAIGHHQECVAGVGHGFQGPALQPASTDRLPRAGGRDRRTWREPCRRCCRQCSCRSGAAFHPAPARWPQRHGRDRAWLRERCRRPCVRASPWAP